MRRSKVRFARAQHRANWKRGRRRYYLTIALTDAGWWELFEKNIGFGCHYYEGPIGYTIKEVTPCQP